MPGASTQASLTLRSDGPARTQAIGHTLGEQARSGAVLLLSGALGAGKTALTQGIGAGMGITQIINSPTFTLLKEHRGRLPLYHFDLYRIEDPDELYTLGFEDYFAGDGVAVVEWAERGVSADGSPPIWGGDTLSITIEITAERERTLRCVASGKMSRAWLATLRGGA
jgi:tRNA threonylcarbamoyladenosine biosynthesis protein TsaE